jgi:hypothetical protein
MFRGEVHVPFGCGARWHFPTVAEWSCGLYDEGPPIWYEVALTS